jgi:hypothetical protein
MWRRSLWTLLVVSAFAQPGALFAEPGPKPARESEVAGRKAPDLAGEWKLFLPAGFERTVTLEPAPDGRYFLSPYNLGGTYELRGDRLVRLSTERLAPGTKVELSPAFEWELRGPYFLTLVREPENPPGDYLGAVLFRAKESEEKKRASAVEPNDPVKVVVADAAPFSPLAIDLSKTRLDVKLLPGEKGARFPDGNLVFPVTIRNRSKQTIGLKLPSGPGTESSIAAHVRQVDASQPEKKTQPTVTMHVYRAGDGAEKPEMTIFPGESFEFDAKLNWPRAGEPQRRLVPQRSYEIQLSMTFMAEGKLQYLVAPGGSVVTFDPLSPAR